MVAVKAHFDGETIVVPDELRGRPAQEVIIVYRPDQGSLDEQEWLKAQESTFAKAWDNDADSAYDHV